jgi:Na+/proline symporter
MELTTDQAVVQRYLTTKDEKEATKTLWLNAATSIPWALTIFILGTAIYLFYKSNPGMQNPLIDSDGIVSLFIIQKVPVGLSGLIIAGIFSAAMSSLDSSMHSVAKVLTTDFYGRFSKKSVDHKKLNLARYIIIFLGLFGTSVACWMSSLNITSMFDIFLELTGLFAGSVAGLFLLGIFTERANQTGAMIGAITSGLVLLIIKN